ncbi:MAG: InlB B-repeat-containing protein [Chitinispirillales bacterium]|nr:InlB B-repeat-containing protein [Chitinispirillales bacterium]
MADGSWDCGAEGSNLTCTRLGDALTVSGVGAMKDYMPSLAGISAPWGAVENVVIETGVTYIGANAFSNLTSNFEITVDAENPPTVADRAFIFNTASSILRVPQASIDAYRNADVWKDFGYINPSTVTFNAGSESNIEILPQLVGYGSYATKPEDPTASGNTFKGWLKRYAFFPEETDLYWDFGSDTVTSDITLVAHWMPAASVSADNRSVPPVNQTEEAAIGIGIANANASGFTAGSNPAPKSSDGITFFWQGALIANASLAVYDASGNVVKTLSIRDNSVGTQSKRSVGSWNLKDAKGRLAPDGTYLVKGTSTAADGKGKRVSLLVGVR